MSAPSGQSPLPADITARRKHWGLIAAGFVAVIALSWTILNVPVMAQVIVPLSVVAVGIFFAAPLLGVTAIFLGRISVDLLHGVPLKIASMNLLELYAGGATLLMLALLVLEFKRVERHPVLQIFTVYMTMLLIGGARNLEIRTAAELLARFTSPFLFMFAITALFNTRARRRKLIWLTLAATAIPVAVSLFHLATGQRAENYLHGFYRLHGGYSNMHTHALMMMFISTLSGWATTQARGRWARLACGALFTAAIVCMYYTYVRTALLNFALFAAMYLWFTGRKKELILATVIALSVASLSPTMQERFKDFGLFFDSEQVELDREDLGSGRWGIWTRSMSNFLDYPPADILLGLGIGNHFWLSHDWVTTLHAQEGRARDPHNDYLALLYQLGPIAMGAYILMTVRLIRSGMRMFRKSPDPLMRHFGAYMAALGVGAMAANTFSNAYVARITLGWLFWGLSGVVFAEVMELDREEGKADSQAPRRRRFRPIPARERPLIPPRK